MTESTRPIRADEAYSLEDLKRLGIGAAALRRARRAGLPMSKFGQRKFVRGEALIQFFKRMEVLQRQDE